MDNITSQDGADITPASVPKEKLIMDEEYAGTRVFDLNHLYPVEKFMNVITEELKESSANYVYFSHYLGENEVNIEFYNGREETDDEFDERMVREKWAADDSISSQYKADYIQYLSLKAKFE